MLVSKSRISYEKNHKKPFITVNEGVKGWLAREDQCGATLTICS
jgi:hypothetical protein